MGKKSTLISEFHLLKSNNEFSLKKILFIHDIAYKIPKILI